VGRGPSVFPELGQAFYASGPRRWTEKIADFLQTPRSRERLDINDPLLAADQLAQLCRADLLLKVMFGIQRSASEEDIAHIANEAVKTFVARYGRAVP
jgi:TetR/AcrR family transcriptional repressor of mexJK operon